jgi:predicted AAA+ superfamily ATPase
MKRLYDHYLSLWKHDSIRKPLLLRGARQVGKTYAVRKLGQTFERFIEINLEETPRAREIFEKDLIVERIMRDISLLTGQDIIAGKTLLFIDEIQLVPQAVLALRYFYEKVPQLHVIAAGSLLDFAIAQVGIPVGRVQLMYMYPLSFIEFLAAMKEHQIIKEIMVHELGRELTTVIHEKILEYVAHYQVIGGMPATVENWQKNKNPHTCQRISSSILETYRHDFVKYAKRHQIKYLELLFKEVPRQLSQKFKYSDVEGEYRKRELAPALDLLETAGLTHKVHYSACQGFPFGAQTNPQDFKVIFLDIGLAETMLSLNLQDWFLDPLGTLVNKGAIVEAFVGQEMLVYADPFITTELFYWHRESPSSQAEIDYVIQQKDAIIPIEVKGGSGKTLKSMHLFLESHKQSPYGIRFSTNNYSLFEKLHSYPLYAIAKVIGTNNFELLRAINSLVDK